MKWKHSVRTWLRNDLYWAQKKSVNGIACVLPGRWRKRPRMQTLNQQWRSSRQHPCLSRVNTLNWEFVCLALSYQVINSGISQPCIRYAVSRGSFIRGRIHATSCHSYIFLWTVHLRLPWQGWNLQIFNG